MYVTLRAQGYTSPLVRSIIKTAICAPQLSRKIHTKCIWFTPPTFRDVDPQIPQITFICLAFQEVLLNACKKALRRHWMIAYMFLLSNLRHCVCFTRT